MAEINPLKPELWNNRQKILILENREFIEPSDKFVYKLLYVLISIYGV